MVSAGRSFEGIASWLRRLGPRLRRAGPWVLVAVSTLAVAALDRELRPRWARGADAQSGAQWIWDHGSSREVVPRAFYLAQDFTLDQPPDRAWLSVLADEEYLVYLNGVLVGSNRFHSGAKLDRYPVASRLRAGGNRLLVEVRSGRGVGGLLVRLDDGAGRTWLVSNGDWRVFRSLGPGLFAGWAPLSSGEAAKVWGPPPVGRWGSPEPGVERPIRNLSLPTERLAGGDAVLHAEWPATDASGNPRLYRGALFDFGASRVASLGLRLAKAGASPGLIWLGETPPRPESAPADMPMLLPPGSPSWRSTTPRPFRFVWVLSGEAIVEVERWVEPGPEVPAEPTALDLVGAFGIRPPPRLPPLEAEIRRLLPRGLPLATAP